MSLPKVQWQNYVVYIFFALVLVFSAPPSAIAAS